MNVWMLQWNAYVPGFMGAVNVTVLPGSLVTSNPPAVVSAETVCCALLTFLTVTVAPAATGCEVNMKSSLIVIVGPEAADEEAEFGVGGTPVTLGAAVAVEVVALLLEPHAAPPPTNSASAHKDFTVRRISGVRSRRPSRPKLSRR